MFETNAFVMRQTLGQLSYACSDQGTRAEMDARSLYAAFTRQNWLKRIKHVLFGPRHTLQDLTQLAHQHPLRSHYSAGLKTVAIQKILGSEGRCEDFDADFTPLKNHNRARWLSVAAARFQRTTLPAIELIQVSGAYFVRDGHHRISVARALGEEAIEAEVTVWEFGG